MFLKSLLYDIMITVVLGCLLFSLLWIFSLLAGFEPTSDLFASFDSLAKVLRDLVLSMLNMLSKEVF